MNELTLFSERSRNTKLFPAWRTKTTYFNLAILRARQSTLRISHLVLLAIFLMAAQVSAFAQVSVSSLTVNSGDPTKLTIRGAGFGNGPNVVLFDNFSRTTDTEITTNSPIVGSWLSVGSGATKGSQAVSFSGTQSARVIDTNSEYTKFNMVFGINDSKAPNGLKLFDEIYLSYAIRDLGNFPGDGGTKTSFSDRSSAKDAWLMLGNRGDKGQHELNDSWLGNDIVAPSWVGGNFLVSGNSTALGFWQRDLMENWAFGDWNQMFFHAKVDSSNPYSNGWGFFGHINKNMVNFKYRSGAFMTYKEKEPYWDRIKFAAWHHLGNGGVVRMMDEIYVAIGPNSAARIMIGDNPNINNVTRLHHALPTSWASDKISFDVNALKLDTSRSWYVYVFNSTNEYNGQGVPLLESTETLPSPPKLRILE